MDIKNSFGLRSILLKGHVNRYALLGLIISVGSILFATFFVSYQMTGSISLSGFILAQKSNPAIWALDLSPFMFAYWGQAFCYGLANRAELIIEDKTREFVSKSGDLELKLHYESNHDGLTNLPNAKLVSQRIIQAMTQLQKGENLVLIIINIRNFKDINYEYGNFSANSLLLQFSETLKSLLLEPYMLQAYMGMNMIARLQGAEFALLIPRLRREHNIDEILNNIIDYTSMTYMIDGNSMEVHSTAGVALYPEHGTDDDTLIHHATLSLFYAEKHHKKYAIYEPSMQSASKTKRVVFKEIGIIIENEELELLFQPHYHLKTLNIIGAEATIGITHSKYGKLDAEKLVSIVNETSLVKKISIFLLRSAVHQLAQWQKEGHKNLYMNVQLYNPTDLEIPSYIESLLQENNISARLLKISVTEKACLSDQTRSFEVLNALSDLGMEITISDFCSGYTSFVYLTNYPITEVVIDPSFVMSMMKDEKKHTIVKAIIKVAKAMNIHIFAQGISNEESVEELVSLGCVQGAGSYFYTPLAIGSMDKLLTRQDEKESE